jgi:hypothetical protein
MKLKNYYGYCGYALYSILHEMTMTCTLLKVFPLQLPGNIFCWGRGSV